MEKQFAIGDRVRVIKSPGSAEVGAEGVITGPYIFTEGWQRVEWDRSNGLAHWQNDGVYYTNQFEIVTPVADYYEPCSTYRSCMDGNKYVVEAVRVKIICTCTDEDESKRIADALNMKAKAIQ